MNKKLLILLAFALVVIPLASACGRTAPTGGTTLPAPKVPHVVDVRFENCNVCHVADQLRANVPLPHATKQVVLGKTVSIYYPNKDCISPACHTVQAGVTTPPPTTTTTTTPPADTTGGTGTTTTSATLKTLPEIGLPNTTHNKAALAAYKTIGCLFCHGPTGSNPNPYAPTWDAKASTHNTGIFAVTPGSKADHTGYTNDTDCEQVNCHAPPIS